MHAASLSDDSLPLTNDALAHRPCKQHAEEGSSQPSGPESHAAAFSADSAGRGQIPGDRFLSEGDGARQHSSFLAYERHGCVSESVTLFLSMGKSYGACFPAKGVRIACSMWFFVVEVILFLRLCRAS